MTTNELILNQMFQLEIEIIKEKSLEEKETSLSAVRRGWIPFSTIIIGSVSTPVASDFTLHSNTENDTPENINRFLS